MWLWCRWHFHVFLSLVTQIPWKDFILKTLQHRYYLNLKAIRQSRNWNDSCCVTGNQSGNVYRALFWFVFWEMLEILTEIGMRDLISWPLDHFSRRGGYISNAVDLSLSGTWFESRAGYKLMLVFIISFKEMPRTKFLQILGDCIFYCGVWYFQHNYCYAPRQHYVQKCLSFYLHRAQSAR
jgi:hypothetical protein